MNKNKLYNEYWDWRRRFEKKNGWIPIGFQTFLAGRRSAQNQYKPSKKKP